MPELPEVETIRRSLEPKLTGHVIEDVELIWSRAVKHPSLEEFTSQLRGRRIEAVDRRGKHLIIVLSEGYALVVHLRMTGRLLYRLAGTPRQKHTTAVFHLDGQKELQFADTRKFGVLHLVERGDWRHVSSMRDLGPEPLSDEFTVDHLTRVLAGRRGRLKARLLDQTAIAGLGNIYVDEACFRAGVHPGRDCDSLTPAEIRRLHGAIREVISEGIAHRGTTFRDYLDGDGRVGEYQERLAVYGRAKEPCLKCGSIIARSVVAGRGTFTCPKCQGQPRPADRGEESGNRSAGVAGAKRSKGSAARKTTR